MRVLRILVCLLLLAVPTSAQSARAAMVTDLSGRVQVGGQAARILQVLPVSAGLEVGPQSRVTLIFFQDSHVETLTGPCRFRVTEGGAELLAGEPAQKISKSPTAMRLPSRGERAETMGGTMQRGSSSLTMKHALTGPPVFTWTGLDKPMLVVVCRGLEANEWEVVSPPSTSGVTYAGPALVEDQLYRWELRNDLIEEEPPFANFVVLSKASQDSVRAAEAELSQADANDVSARVLMMSVYAEHYMLEEAVQAGLAAVALRPDDAGLHRALALLYRELGRSEEAERESTRAR